MKQNNGGVWSSSSSRINNGFTVVFFVAFLVLMSCSSSASAARALLLSTTPSAIVNVAGAKSIQYINHHDAATEAASSTDFSDLMGGFEECDEKDNEECEKRRMVAEAHLDYIYTQNHKHP